MAFVYREKDKLNNETQVRADKQTYIFGNLTYYRDGLVNQLEKMDYSLKSAETMTI